MLLRILISCFALFATAVVYADPHFFSLESGKKTSDFSFEIFGPQPNQKSLQHVQMIFQNLIRNYFPRLIEYQIRLESFSDKTSFLQAQPDFLTITKTPMNRIYSVQINPLLLKYYPGDLAIQAIGVHELFHISDYINMNSTQLLGLGVIYGLIGANHKISTELVINYERKTDERTLALGFSEGLKLYRFWLYKMIALVPGAIEWKQRAYCTPAEIDQFVVNQSCRITNER